MLPPLSQSAMACRSQARARAWWGWSVRDAASRTLRSGVIVRSIEHRAVRERIHAGGQTALTVVNGE